MLDGFKSYAQRTEVNGFDPLFNAITGLNGSGKSNILDGICFLLGISNLSQVNFIECKNLMHALVKFILLQLSLGLPFILKMAYAKQSKLMCNVYYFELFSTCDVIILFLIALSMLAIDLYYLSGWLYTIGITFRKYGLTLYDNDACIKCAVHKALLDCCNGIPRN